MSKPHIVEVVGNYPAQTFLMRHLIVLSQVDNFKITVASKGPRSYEEASIQKTEQTYFPVVYLPDSRHSRSHQAYHVLRSLAFRHPDFSMWDFKSKALANSLNRLKPDLVHFQFGQLAVMLYPHIKALKIPYTVSLRGSEIQELPVTDPAFADNLCQVLEQAVSIHTVCDAFGDTARTFCNRPLATTTIRTCLPPLDICTNTKPTDLRFITVGRLHWRKAFDDLIRAMIHLPHARLEIIGDGPEYQYLQYVIHFHQLQDRVRIHGNLPFAQFREKICNASAYVQSSIAEGFSNALAEAMMMGQAVFATPVGGTNEIIQDEVNGILIPVGDPRGMAEKLALAEDSELLIRIGKAAWQTAQTVFDMSNHATQFTRFYESALSS